MRGRQKPEIHESADFLVAGWRHSTLLSPVESLPRPDVYIAREKGRWKKRRSLCFGNWPNPAMFSICSKAPLVQHPPSETGQKRADVLQRGDGEPFRKAFWTSFCARNLSRNDKSSIREIDIDVVISE